MVFDRFALAVMPSNRLLIALALSLSMLGLVMVTSASLQIAETRLGSPFHFAMRHGVFLMAALVVASLTYLVIPTALLHRLRHLALLAATAALVLVLLPGIGREVNGSQRWISLAGFNMQPSEFAKLGFIVYLAGYIAEHREALETSWDAFLKPLAILGGLTLLLLMEPDFGAVVVLGMAAMGMLFLSGVPTLRFLLVGLVAVILAAVVAMAQPYRVARLMSFVDPWQDQFGGGYQLTQSLIAFGRGGIDGVGLGNSVQKLFYLPEAHTDFVFAVTAEEFGLLGTLLVLGLFAALCLQIFRIGGDLLARGDVFRGQLVIGIGFVIATQAFINMGVNMGLLPTKGLTLPFVSYGGSSLLVSAIMLGLVLRAETEGRATVPSERTRRRP